MILSNIQPREKMKIRGPASLSDKELLAIILNTGIQGKPVTALAEELLGILDNYNEIPPLKEIAELCGMGFSKACTIQAMLEFGRRRYGTVSSMVRKPSDIFMLVRHFADRKQERFITISLNGAHEVIATRIVTIGLLNKVIVHPREVFADLIQDRAAAFCVAHNHPSGKIEGSEEDDIITERLQKASKILGLQFVDHIIFSENSYWSYKENKKILNDEEKDVI